MSASARTAQAGIGYSGFKSTFAALALVVILAATVVVVALGVSRSAATPATQANPIQVPAVLDKGSRGEMNAAPAVPYIIDRDKGALGGAVAPALPWGGWNGPRAADPGDASKDDTYVPSRTGSGGHNGTRFAQ